MDLHKKACCTGYLFRDFTNITNSLSGFENVCFRMAKLEDSKKNHIRKYYSNKNLLYEYRNNFLKYIWRFFMNIVESNVPKSRMFFIDNIRLIMIIIVVLVHTSVTYSGIGGWYYIENKSVDTVSKIIFEIFNTFSQAYFMGFLFLIGAYILKKENVLLEQALSPNMEGVKICIHINILKHLI
ncbi:hypothetical protein Clopa_1948 [Clostridium pasteurianum BC1]|uniref:Acyltransferase 3 domain-containing protein n=2 Tax=Clostridium pasteurianum TaxID=1501 RepID=R4K2M9_CLOPA|nr:hypothetical protein Clopa_1948 [Clostridium pasteurianum BC1]